MLNKAKDNYETGKWAESQKYFDVAVSRYYYCIYQKIIYIAKKRGFYTKPTRGEDSHIYMFKEFKAKIFKELSDGQLRWLDKLTQLRQQRNNAEYHESKIKDLNEFNLTFKYSFERIDSILNTFL